MRIPFGGQIKACFSFHKHNTIFAPVLYIGYKMSRLRLDIVYPIQYGRSYSQDEIACFRISETWRKHAAPWFRYIYVLRKRENSNLRDSVTSPERKCQVTFPSYLSQQISAVVRFRHVSAYGSAVVCYIYQSTNAR